LSLRGYLRVRVSKILAWQRVPDHLTLLLRRDALLAAGIVDPNCKDSLTARWMAYLDVRLFQAD